eukprot:3656164-Ditylum_brightwellii.AAC.1
MQDDLNQEIQEIQQRQAIRSNGFLSMLSTTDTSNEEGLQWHQDHDTATKIQSISHGFIHCKQMITEHTAAVII